MEDETLRLVYFHRGYQREQVKTLKRFSNALFVVPVIRLFRLPPHHGVGISLSSDCMNLFFKELSFSRIGSFLYLIKKTNSSIIFSLHLEIKMFNIKNERKAVFVKWASRSHLDVIEEKWYSNELLAKKKKRIFQLKKCNAKRNMRSSTNAREGGTLPPATRNNTSPIIMQWGYVKTVRSISCKKKQQQQMGSITAPWIRVAIPTPSQSQRLIRYRKRLAMRSN